MANKKALLLFGCLFVLIVQVELRRGSDELEEWRIKEYHDQLMSNREKSELAREMAITGDENPQAKVPCISGSVDPPLTELILKYLINSVFHTFDDAPVSTYYALTDYGRNISQNEDPLHLLWSTSLDLSSTHPTVLWLNHPPPINSSHYLMQIYDNVDPKPTIEILGMFTVGDLNSFIDQLKCLAKLKYMGFGLVHWDIEDFKENMDELHCQELLDQASSTTGFSEEVKIVENLLQHVNEMSQNPNIENWCPTPTSMIAKVQDIQAKQLKHA